MKTVAEHSDRADLKKGTSGLLLALGWRWFSGDLSLGFFFSDYETKADSVLGWGWGLNCPKKISANFLGLKEFFRHFSGGLRMGRIIFFDSGEALGRLG